MRLNRLDLTRYGKFTDRTIDFGPRPDGAPDLHVVYGANEAGKSTLLAAFLDLLFGIEMCSPYGFLHPHPTMCLGASLEIDGRDQAFVRVKKPQNSLRDANGELVSEAVLRLGLGGLDRDSYCTMFSLDDETLEKGGDSILESKGDLGQILFSATAGLADLGRNLTELRAEADAFCKKHARGSALHEFKARLAELKVRGEALAIRASDYAALKQARDAKAGQYEEALVFRNSLQVRMDEIKRYLSAVPRLRELRSLRERLAPLADLPEVPFGGMETLRELQENEVALDTRMQGVEADIARLASELDAAPPDELALALAPRVQQLADLRARYTTAEKDIPERRSECRDAALAVAGILARIDRRDEADPQRLLLGTAVVGPLRELIEQRSGIEACLAAAEREAKNAAQRLQEAEAQLRDTGEAAPPVRRPPTLASLAVAADAMRCGGHAAQLSHAERSQVACLEALVRQMQLLAPWQGEADQLAGMAVPALSKIEGWRTAIQHSEQKIEQAQAEIDRLTMERVRQEAKRAAMNGIGVPDEHEAITIRSEREHAWSEHRRQLDAATAKSFETALRRDDAFAVTRIGCESEIAALRQLSEAIAVAEAELGHARSLRDREQNALREQSETIATALRSISPALADMAPSRLEAWLDRRSKALDARASLAEAESDLRMARADREAARCRLVAALKACGVSYAPEDGADALLAAAQATIDREAELATLRCEI